MSSQLLDWVERARAAEEAANRVLAGHGDASARIVFLADASAKLEACPVDVQEYFGEAALCLRNGLTRAAVVLSWAGFYSLFSERLFHEKSDALSLKYTKWDLSSLDSLRELPEAQILDAASHKDIGFIRRSDRRILDGWLSQRNKCAHPSVYRPSENVAIGYVDALVDQVLRLASQ